MYSSVLPASVAALLLAAVLPAGASAQRMYTSKSPVLQVDAKSWKKQIVEAHLPSIVEFYAPWCGHCQNLKPAYEKAASSLSGIVQIAAVNCDEDSNKGLCSQLGIQGFPTLKTVRPAALIGLGAASAKSSSKPSKKASRPAISDYKGPRSAKEIAEAAKLLLPNIVTRVTDAELATFLSNDNATAKALLFSDKGTTSALIKAIALDFHGSMSVSQVRDREDDVVDMFGVESFPKLVVLPGGDKAPVAYDGEMNKPDMLDFLKQYAEPVSGASAGKKPDPSSSSSSSSSKAPKSKKDKTAEKKSKAAKAAKPSAADETLEDPDVESPQPTVDGVPKPARVPVEAPAPLPTLATSGELAARCLGPKTGTCVLALLPPTDGGELPAKAAGAVAALASLDARSREGNAHALPIYAVADAAGATLKKALAVDDGAADGQISLLAVNGKRGWIRRHAAAAAAAYAPADLATWIEGVKLGDVKKEALPEELIRTEEEIDAEPEVKDEL